MAGSSVFDFLCRDVSICVNMEVEQAIIYCLGRGGVR